ncbi:hypothetical protein GGQ62_000297 [Polymorphobacter fuscus]|uniref:hypothetical protein n=1 Tax=Sandarakinorhabdus fusca TaxID=1439888 RepID=UPI0014317853|nr:hypothetical protein [Polymorphobacter fuscus]NJC07299.1 hypothetical protein [Polymorphobacter fuscus]
MFQWLIVLDLALPKAAVEQTRIASKPCRGIVPSHPRPESCREPLRAESDWLRNHPRMQQAEMAPRTAIGIHDFIGLPRVGGRRAAPARFQGVVGADPSGAESISASPPSAR